ncbi:CAP domain-containing protein [Bacillus sp. 31A1R]|uniref:CAP domain-containing protein n=1 Tax=Robertmurraya mangrovi TaxID=3098077 RepID=A0ABU5IU34_9BACI|nr:CAP domain-containing protein [Bacillus sp. 31A1R]MDZ5470663.1 CAP domain-containing protein [Bacillus sp. 31A1R]
MSFWRVIIIFLCTFVCLFGKATASISSIYHVKKGDTLWNISSSLNLDFKDLLDVNPQLENPDIIFPGDEINIPRKKENKSRFIGKTQSIIFEYANEKRIKAGLTPLILDDELSKAAVLKAEDMRKNEYVAHNSPTYGNPTVMLEALHIPFQTVKENIGAGQKSEQEVFHAWMNSIIQRENLLDKEATHIGIGYAEGGLHGHYWTTFIIKR